MSNTTDQKTKSFDAGKVITKLKGTAPEQHNPQPVEISGTITAPSRFLNRRKGEFDPLKAYCIASTTDGILRLTVNEQSVCDLYHISGKVELGKLFKNIGINNTSVNYTPLKLAQKFRMLRSIFPNKQEHLTITTKLRNLKAKVNKDIEESKDDRANASVVFRQTVESNVPESFKLHLPLLEGEAPQTIEVNVILEVQGNDIVCFLESVEGQEMIDNAKEKLVKDEVKKIEKDVLVIYE